MRWDKKSHINHLMQLQEFYSLNKYFMTEQTKDVFLDAIDCMERVIKDEDEDVSISDIVRQMLLKEVNND